MNFGKKFIIIVSLSIVLALSSITITSFSQLTLQDISEKMVSTSGPTIVKVSGESSAVIPKDNTRRTINITTKPSELNTLEKERTEKIDKIINLIYDSLGKDNVSITTGYVSYNSQWSNNSPDMSSISAHIEMPIKTKIENISNVTKIISDNGFWINNLQIQKSAISEIDTNLKVTLPMGSGSPGCESTDSCYIPYNKVLKAGETLAWENKDAAAHTITSGTPEEGPDGVFDSGLIMADAIFSHSFDTFGEYNYFCLVHPWMVGKVTVVDSDNKGNSKTETKPIEYQYQASLSANIDLPPNSIDKTIIAYQEKLDKLNTALSEYQLEDKSNTQGKVYFNPTYWPSSAMANGFTSQTQLFIDVNYEDLELVLKTIKDSGANFEGFSLTYSPESLEVIRKEITQSAIENAKERALEIISPMNLQIKGIKSIEVRSDPINSQYGNQPMFIHGIMLRAPYYDTNQGSEASIIVDVEFEVGR